MSPEQIAIVCHQAYKSLCEVNQEFSQVDWPHTTQERRDLAIARVNDIIENPDRPPLGKHDLFRAIVLALK